MLFIFLEVGVPQTKNMNIFNVILYNFSSVQIETASGEKRVGGQLPQMGKGGKITITYYILHIIIGPR